MKKIFEEFKQFALKGSVVDLAVGVLIGGAFQGIVKSFTDNIISPVIGLIGKTDFKDITFKIGAVEIKYGAFITDVINFIIMAFIIFLIVKGINKLKNFSFRSKVEEKVEPTTKKCAYCMSEININATRCPNCTSKLEGFSEAVTEQENS